RQINQGKLDVAANQGNVLTASNRSREVEDNFSSHRYDDQDDRLHEGVGEVARQHALHDAFDSAREDELILYEIEGKGYIGTRKEYEEAKARHEKERALRSWYSGKHVASGPIAALFYLMARLLTDNKEKQGSAAAI